MAAGFGGMRLCVGWLIFMYKVILKIIGLTFYWEGGGGFMKNVAVTFSVQESNAPNMKT